MALRERLRLRRRTPSPQADGTMTLVEHLSELRSRLVKSLLAFVVITAVVAFFSGPIQSFLTQPFCEATANLPQGTSQIGVTQTGPGGGDTDRGRPQQTEKQCEQTLVFLQVYGAFAFKLKLISIVGLALSSPVWLYQFYAFILPALRPNEKRYSFLFLLSAIVLFLVGSTFAYFTLSKALGVLLGFGGQTLTAAIVADEYLKFVGLMILGFGASFELPLILIFLSLAEVIEVETLRKGRRAAVVLIFVLAAVVTPSTDPMTMSLLAVPLYTLYELTILIVARIMRRRARREQEAAQPA